MDGLSCVESTDAFRHSDRTLCAVVTCIEVIAMRICAGQQLSRAGFPFAVLMQCMLFTHQLVTDCVTARLFQFLESFACHAVAPHLPQRQVPSSDLHPSVML
jgi:hypothetical protein